MNAAQTLATLSLIWVEIQSPDQAPYWTRTTNLLWGVDEAERAFTLAQLKTGSRIIYESSGLSIQCRSMSAEEKKRLTHLLRFESGGFLLDLFRLNSALYYKNGKHHYSMNEMIERGNLPQPTIALNPLNVCLTGSDGHLLDVFVPTGTARVNFTNAYVQ